MNCPTCGAVLDRNAKACAGCGAPVTSTSEPRPVRLSQQDARMLARENELAKGRSYLLGMFIVFIAIAAWVLWDMYS